MHIGLIGGIGVAATVVYYQRLTAAVPTDLELTIVHADVQTLVANTMADRREEQAEVYARLIDRLAGAGCDCAAITSLGGHFCFDETEKISALPLVSGVTPLDSHFAAEGLDCVGLLGTRVVMASRLYGQLTRTKAVTLDERTGSLGQAYLDMAVAGRATPELQKLFVEAGAEMVRDHGAQAIVLAGTDLGLAFSGITPGYRVIDALDVHVDLLAQLARGETSL